MVNKAACIDAKGPRRTSEGYNRPINKIAVYAEDFHVNGTIGDVRVPGNLADDIGHLIDRQRSSVADREVVLSK